MLTANHYKLTPTEELEIQAKEKLDPLVYDFIAGGAGSEWGLKNNRDAFRKYTIVPRVLQNVSDINISLEIFGNQISSPILIAPCAFHKLVCPRGEIDTAIAANKIGTIMTLSTMSNCTIEEVANASNALKWFQLYVFKNHDITKYMVKRAEKSGYTALVVTVDVPAMGMRLRDIRNQFKLPSNIDAANFRDVNLSSLSEQMNGSKIKEHTDQQFDAGLTWEAIDWLFTITKLPIILKGILNTEDALEAINHRVSGIIVSNHGGRQMDSVISGLDVLPDIVEILENRIPVFVDGGIRSGEDVLKAIALGATAVMIGRPVMWSLAIGGENHLVSMFQKLEQELILTMRLTGCASLNKIHEKGLSLLSSQHLIFRKIQQQLENNSLFIPVANEITKPPMNRLFK